MYQMYDGYSDDEQPRHRKRKGVDNDSVSTISAESDAENQPKKRPKGKGRASAPTAAPKPLPPTAGPDGLLRGVDVIELDAPTRKSRADRTQDMKVFFSAPYLKNDKKYRDCLACSKLYKKSVALINEATTLRRHQQANHPTKYCKWAADNNFESMLPEDAKHRRDLAHEREAVASTSTLSRQTSLDGHLAPKEPVIRYSESNFHTAAIRWIIETDQPLEALQHPSFKKMIDIASRAPNGVNIPDSKTTRLARGRRSLPSSMRYLP